MKKETKIIFFITILLIIIGHCLFLINHNKNNNNHESNKESILAIIGIIEEVEVTKGNIIMNIYNTVPNKDIFTDHAIVNAKNNIEIKIKDSDKDYSISDFKIGTLVEVYIKDIPEQTYPTTIEASEIKVITSEHLEYLKYIGDMCYNILSTDQQESITNKTPNISEMRFEKGFKAYNINEFGTIYTDIGNQDVYVVEFIQDKLMMTPNNIIIYVSKDNLETLGFGLVD